MMRGSLEHQWPNAARKEELKKRGMIHPDSLISRHSRDINHVTKGLRSPVKMQNLLHLKVSCVLAQSKADKELARNRFFGPSYTF